METIHSSEWISHSLIESSTSSNRGSFGIIHYERNGVATTQHRKRGQVTCIENEKESCLFYSPVLLTRRSIVVRCVPYMFGRDFVFDSLCQAIEVGIDEPTMDSQFIQFVYNLSLAGGRNMNSYHFPE